MAGTFGSQLAQTQQQQPLTRTRRLQSQNQLKSQLVNQQISQTQYEKQVSEYEQYQSSIRVLDALSSKNYATYRVLTPSERQTVDYISSLTGRQKKDLVVPQLEARGIEGNVALRIVQMYNPAGRVYGSPSQVAQIQQYAEAKKMDFWSGKISSEGEPTKYYEGGLQVKPYWEVPLSTGGTAITPYEPKMSISEEEARNYLKRRGFGEEVSLIAPATKTWQKIWDVIKAGYYASPFGINYGGVVSPEPRKQVSLGNIGGMPQINILTLSGSDAYKKIKESRALDYEERISSEELRKLELLSRGGGQIVSSKEISKLKPFILEEGYGILEKRGLEMKKTTTTEVLGDKILSSTTREITDPAFDRRLSETMLKAERDIARANQQIDAGGLGWEGKTSALITLSEGMAVKGIETILLLGGGKAVLKGGVGLYKNLGLPTAKFYKTIKLAEGTARVPRTFTTLKTTANVGIAGLYAYGKVKQYQSFKATSETAGVPTFVAMTLGELAGIEAVTGIGKNTYRRGKSIINEWKTPTIKEADISEMGFLRENKLLGGKQRIYMRRYRGLQLTNQKSWLQTMKGYKKGQFTEQVKKLVADEVTAYYKYGEDVEVFDKGGKLIKKYDTTISSLRGNYRGITKEIVNIKPKVIKKIKAEAFPFDKPSTHLDWATRRNILEFGIGKESKLPINIKDYKGFGYSATPKKWADVSYSPEKIMRGNKVLAELKGALRFYSFKGGSEGFLRTSTSKLIEESGAGKEAISPTLYAGYFKNVKINLATGEIKGLGSVSGMKIKYPVYTKDTGELGTINLGLMKREVEGTAEFEGALDIRKRGAIWRSGFKVPVIEQVLGGKAELQAIKTAGGLTSNIRDAGISSLPSRSQSLNKAIYSLLGRASKSSRKKSVNSSVASQISRISRVSGSPTSSRASVVSRVSRLSSSSNISSIMSRINSQMSRVIGSSPSRVEKTRKFPYSRTSSNLKSKIKNFAIRKRTPEVMGLFPDFTARAIGLEPEEIELKDVLKKMSKIQTGFEVRTGARLKGKIKKKFRERDLLKLIV